MSPSDRPAPYTRRRALQLAGLGLVTAAAGAAALAWTTTHRTDPSPAPDDGETLGASGSFVEPTVLRSPTASWT